jgi:hypothetical protein
VATGTFAKILAVAIVPVAFVAPFVVAAQTTAGTLIAEQLKPLVSDKTWAITFGGELKDPARTAYWDFKADGSLCGRQHGSKAGTKCADSGHWKLQSDAICWQFQWIGETYGYKSLCVRVRKMDEKMYEAIDQSGRVPPVPFYPLN